MMNPGPNDVIFWHEHCTARLSDPWTLRFLGRGVMNEIHCCSFKTIMDHSLMVSRSPRVWADLSVMPEGFVASGVLDVGYVLAPGRPCQWASDLGFGRS